MARDAARAGRLGAPATRFGRRKRWLGALAVAWVASAASLVTVHGQPGQEEPVGDAIEDKWNPSDDGNPFLSAGLQGAIFDALCSSDGNNNTAGGAISSPLFCAAEDVNMTEVTQAKFEVTSNGTLVQQYPDGNLCESTNATLDICTIENLLVVPTVNYRIRRMKQMHEDGVPRPESSIKASFADLIFGASGGGAGTEKFQSSISLATKSCSLRCEEGYECAPDIDNVLLASQGLGTCQACVRGTFCPEGTINDGGLLVASSKVNLCPAGYFCPTPTEAYNCPAGYFCPAGSYQPFSCSGLEVGDVKLLGNFCPENSDGPWGLCPPGYYCPSPEYFAECPEGYYCKVQSIYPKPCPVLTECPAGSKTPQISWLSWITIFALFGGLAIALLVIALAIHLNQKKILVHARLSEKRASLLKAIGVKLGLSADQMSYASNLTGFSDNIMRVDIVIKSLSVNVVQKSRSNTVLNKVSITFKAGTLNTILGSSGAGKTTFLKALIGKFATNAYPSGQIRYEFKNEPIQVDLINVEAKPWEFCCSQQLAKLKARETAVRLGVGYVAQDNTVHEILTVHENIAYSARLRLGSKQLSRETQNKVIQDTITILGLNHIQNAKVGNPLSPRGSISGGEARRVSIGLELVACPGLLILDEPTSGLDAVAANDVMSCLSKMTDLGVTVIASLHQPRYSTFLLFDSVHLFMRGGYVVYSGHAGDAIKYFRILGFAFPENENPSDFMLDVLSGLIDLPGNDDFCPTDLIAFWRQNDNESRYNTPRRVRSRSEVPCFDIQDEDLLFKTMDDGHVFVPKQASNQFSSENISDDASKCADVLFSSGETRKEGRVSRKTSVMPTPRWLETLGEQFDRLDTTRKGYIDDDHMLQLLCSMGQTCTLDDAQQIVQHFDVDGDGKVRREDFLLRWTKNYWTREFSTALMKLFPSGQVPDGVTKRKLTGSQSALLSSDHTIDMAEEGDGTVRRRFTTSITRESSSRSTGTSAALIATSRKTIMHSVNGFVTFLSQTWVLLQREPLKWMRLLEMKVLDFFSMAVLGFGYALVNRKNIDIDLNAVRQATTVAMLFVGVISSVWATLFMSRELPMAGREANQGVSVAAEFLALNLCNTAVDLTIRCLSYTLMFYYVTGFKMTFGCFFAVTFGTAWSTSGLGMLASCLTNARSAIVFSVAVSFLFGAVLNGVYPSLKELRESTNPFLYWMVLPSYNRWATEALTLRENEALDDFNFVDRLETVDFGYDVDNGWRSALLFLYMSGLVLRIICFGFFYKKVMN